LRGNLDTRIRKLDDESLDGVVLAAAGIRRMGLEGRVSQAFSCDEFLPAVGQGALAVETKADHEEINALIRSLDHRETRICVEAERAFLARLEGGCQVPIGAYARMDGLGIHLQGMVAGLDGTPMCRDQIRGDPGAHPDLGEQLAERILDRGAKAILEDLYRMETSPQQPGRLD
jgi:hydroxymethylbilane synthase